MDYDTEQAMRFGPDWEVPYALWEAGQVQAGKREAPEWGETIPDSDPEGDFKVHQGGLSVR